jgi:hypothetical protein
MAQQPPPSYDQEEAAYGPRETSLSAVFGFLPQRVFNAMERAVERQGLKTLMASASNGLLLAKPQFSLLNFGRRVTVTFSPAGSEATQVRARYTHGLVSFEDRYARLSMLSDLFQAARLQLEAGDVAREAAQKKKAPMAAAPAQGAPPAPVAQPALEPSPTAPDMDVPHSHPTLNELRAKARIEMQVRHGLPAEAIGEDEFLAEGPAGFRLPAQMKARRVFWFALGVVLAVVLMILLSLGTR